MPWYFYVLAVIGPLAAVAAVFAALHALTLVTGIDGDAAVWQLRCTRCHRTRDAVEAGATRMGAASVAKVIFGHCSRCNAFRWIVLERKPAFASSPSGNAPHA